MSQEYKERAQQLREIAGYLDTPQVSDVIQSFGTSLRYLAPLLVEMPPVAAGVLVLGKILENPASRNTERSPPK